MCVRPQGRQVGPDCVVYPCPALERTQVPGFPASVLIDESGLGPFSSPKQ